MKTRIKLIIFLTSAVFCTTNSFSLSLIPPFDTIEPVKNANSQQVKFLISGDIFGKRVFVKNNGQFDSILETDVKYAYQNGNEIVYFTKDGLTYLLQKNIPLTHEEFEEMEEGKAIKQKPPIRCFVNVNWENCNSNITISEGDEQSYYHTFGEEKYNSKCYKKITYQNVYNYIDIEYILPTERENGIKYNIILHPGANIKDIKIKYTGDYDGISLQNKNIVIKTKALAFTELAPKSIQDDLTLETNFILDKGVISFEVPAGYDASKKLIIDPWVIGLSLGGNNCGLDVDFDNLGNYYVHGGSNPYLTSKYSATGTLLWTFNGVVAAPAWNSGGATPLNNDAGNFVVNKVSGKVYIGQGAVSSGVRVIRLTAAGAYDAFISNVTAAFVEISGLSYGCAGGGLGVASEKITVVGGGFAATGRTAGILNVTSGAIAYSVLNTGTETRQDAVGFAQGPDESLYINGTGGVSIANKILKLNATANGNAWNAPLSPSGTFFEGGNKSYPGAIGGGQSIGFNCLAASTGNVFFYNGNTLSAYSSAGGAVIASVVVGGAVRTMGGIATDDCNNVYVGGIDQILTYTFNGTSFTATAAIPLGLSTVNKNVTDIKYWPTTKELYYCGTGFGGVLSATNSAGCNDPVPCYYTPLPLPVEMLTFDATCLNNGVNLKWVTKSELNNDYFTLQKSHNGEDFVSLGSVKSKGNFDGNTEYNFVDHSSVEGTTYYRLSQTDIDGLSHSFDLLKSDCSQNSIFIYPNPAKNTLHINHPFTGDVMIEIINNKGQIVLSKNYFDQKNISINIGKLTTGLYSIKISSADLTYINRVIIEGIDN